MTDNFKNLTDCGIDAEKLLTHIRQHRHPLVFATISGAHLYGFPSADSDFDLRGTHILPLEQVLGFSTADETIEKEGIYDGLEIDLVTHDVKKFFNLLLRKNGYVLEQVFSPLVVHTTPEHEELKSIAQTCVTRHHYHHYRGFSANQWKLFRSEENPRVKPLLYVLRVLLTGTHLMKTGVIEANLKTLNEEAKLSYIDELIDWKTTGAEKAVLPVKDLTFYESEYQRLLDEMRTAADSSTVRELPEGKAALNDLLVRIRMSQSHA